MNPVTNPTLRRLIVGLSAIATVALNKKLGLQLEASDVVAIAGLAATYILGSNGAQAVIAHADAKKAEAVAAATPDDIAATLATVLAKHGLLPPAVAVPAEPK